MAQHRTVVISPAAGGEDLRSRESLERRREHIADEPDFFEGQNIEGQMKLENMAGGRGDINLDHLREIPVRPLKTED